MILGGSKERDVRRPKHDLARPPPRPLFRDSTTAVVKKILNNFLRFYFTTAVVPFTLVLVRGVVLHMLVNIFLPLVKKTIVYL